MRPRPPDFEELVRDIGTRLRSVCGHLCEEEFLSLVESIAETKRKFLLRDHAEAILGAGWQGPVSTPNLARRLGTIPHARPVSSVPSKSRRETPAPPPP
jgi:hypothetical protein